MFYKRFEVFYAFTYAEEVVVLSTVFHKTKNSMEKPFSSTDSSIYFAIQHFVKDLLEILQGKEHNPVLHRLYFFMIVLAKNMEEKKL